MDSMDTLKISREAYLQPATIWWSRVIHRTFFSTIFHSWLFFTNSYIWSYVFLCVCMVVLASNLKFLFISLHWISFAYCSRSLFLSCRLVCFFFIILLVLQTFKSLNAILHLILYSCVCHMLRWLLPLD